MMGEFTAREILAIAVEAHELAERLGIRCQLVDCTKARNVDSASQNYDFAYLDFPSSVALDKRLRVAILVDPDDHSHDFSDIVMRNAGLNVALFRDRGKAIAHLCPSDPDKSVK